MARLIPQPEQTPERSTEPESTLTASRDARSSRISQLADRVPTSEGSDRNAILSQVRTEKRLAQADQRAALNAALREMEQQAVVAAATKPELA